MGRPVNKRYFKNSATGETFANDRIGIARYKRKGLSTVGTAASARIKDQLSENVFTIEMTAGANPWTEVMELTDDVVTTTTNTTGIGKFNIDGRLENLTGVLVSKLEQHQATVKTSSGVYHTINWPKTRAEAGVSTITSWSIVSRTLSVQVSGEFFYKAGDRVEISRTIDSLIHNEYDISSVRDGDTFVINLAVPSGTTDRSGSSGTVTKRGTAHIDLRE